jgi:hypothetical protein
LCLGLGISLAGCGTPGPAGDRPANPPLSATNDPALSAAADALIPELETRFKETYSGVLLKNTDRTLVIYRKPDAALDEFVRARVQSVPVELSEAKMSLARMREIRDEVMREREQWSARGIEVNGANPKSDGSAVEVFTTRGAPEEQRAFDERYGEGTISVVREKPVDASDPTLQTRVSPRG